MYAKEIQQMEKSKFHLSDHPWISLVTLWGAGILVLFLVVVVANLIGVPGEAPYRPLITPTLGHILGLFIIVPFVLQLPNGKTTFLKYLDDIRLSRIQPFFPLLILGISSSLIMLLFLATNSLVFRITQGLPLYPTFLRKVIDLQANLPPESLSYIEAFPAIFEEVSWRGVILVLFLKQYSVKKSILITAFGFGLLHFLNLIFGVEPAFVIQQVIFGSALGFFYGYLVLRSDSLMPAMLFHFLVNMFIGSFTVYFQRSAPAEIQILYSVINLPIAVTILILWVKLFCNRWIPRPGYS
ncbi:MAG: CPBP family intramembrane metalloprotease [Anaerolineaceae bacterium]|nr:MAG: CPBP family intramembrane metalloprotease [Anaerolineaceae bacterium]